PELGLLERNFWTFLHISIIPQSYPQGRKSFPRDFHMGIFEGGTGRVLYGFLRDRNSRAINMAGRKKDKMAPVSVAVTSVGQVTIPKAFRDALGWGTEFWWRKGEIR
ncbi:AbrB/MazE/SpoVT family DNA-binding domain-containing protein, partial [Candidatus Saccharibacteria bacterium]|nr:AbrB/MazE/SpoVT family DNA-binding domain-containing protein [Candidatus Saccharibacteria bacterium]